MDVLFVKEQEWLRRWMALEQLIIENVHYAPIRKSTMTLTDKDKAALAELAGGTLVPAGGFGSLKHYSFKHKPFVIGYSDWHPDTDGQHILMVLEAFGKHTDVQYYSITVRQFPKGKLCWLSASMTQEWADRNDNKPFRVDGPSIGEIACAAGLEVINQKGGE